MWLAAIVSCLSVMDSHTHVLFITEGSLTRSTCLQGRSQDIFSTEAKILK